MISFKFEPFALLAIIVFSVLVCLGVNLIFFQGSSSSKRAGRFIFINIKNDLSKALDNSRIEQEFLDSGLKTTFHEYYKRYQFFRYLIFFTVLVVLIIKAILTSITFLTISIFAVLFLVTSTKLKIGKHWTLFGHAMRMFDNEYKKKQDIELSSIIIQLQNIAVSQKNEPTTLSYMLSRVVRFANYTKTAFVKMLLYLDQGKVERARNEFINEVSTSLGRDLAYILIELDRIEPSEVINQLKLLEDRVRKENLTHKNNMEEFYSNIIYIVPTLLCFMILLNFLIIILNLVTSSTMNF